MMSGSSKTTSVVEPVSDGVISVIAFVIKLLDHCSNISPKLISQ